MKKLNLNESWKLCKQMWKWVSKNYRKYDNVEDAKVVWLTNHGFEEIDNDCFFCDYDTKHNIHDDCKKCPGKLVDKDFDCLAGEYDYYDKPELFYQKILELDKKRRRG